MNTELLKNVNGSANAEIEVPELMREAVERLKTERPDDYQLVLDNMKKPASERSNKFRFAETYVRAFGLPSELYPEIFGQRIGRGRNFCQILFRSHKRRPDLFEKLINADITPEQCVRGLQKEKEKQDKIKKEFVREHLPIIEARMKEERKVRRKAKEADLARERSTSLSVSDLVSVIKYAKETGIDINQLLGQLKNG